MYFADAYLLRTAFKYLYECENINDTTRPLVEKMIQVYAIYCIMEEMPTFLVIDYFSTSDIDSLREVFRESLLSLRKNALAIVDGFGYTDDELWTVLGSYDGDVYNKLISIVRKKSIE